MTSRISTLLKKDGTLIFPGVYDALSAKLVERAGFPLTFISGYSVAATQLGLPDFGYLTQTEMVGAARRVCASVKIPIIIDADTGYGNALNVIRRSGHVPGRSDLAQTMRAYERQASGFRR